MVLCHGCLGGCRTGMQGRMRSNSSCRGSCQCYRRCWRTWPPTPSLSTSTPTSAPPPAMEVRSTLLSLNTHVNACLLVHVLDSVHQPLHSVSSSTLNMSTPMSAPPPALEVLPRLLSLYAYEGSCSPLSKRQQCAIIMSRFACKHCRGSVCRETRLIVLCVLI